ncbi:MAG: glycosyltransferase family 2 protein [Phreatobacter sp.]|uniref:glycosyltransferase n=1 Tax=Phreatobacter sp. TaxID=1966341 RepID=UPI001A435965|nr:glycosyltransferase [Phreatobacter sp.]MBL8571956.1 glycosyltransferase family 2 protein [Phreatobacter sp.]
MEKTKLDVCICTHNPRADVLRLTLESLAAQSVAPSTFRVLLIDNASSLPLTAADLAPLARRGIEHEIVVESRLGLSRARIRAIDETRGGWILFVDDDNELQSDFIEIGLALIDRHPEYGCFGGKLVLPEHLRPVAWVNPFLPYLGIKDYGDDVIVGDKDEWGPWEPAGAGAWVHRRVLDAYKAQSLQNENFFKLGRTGHNNLASCDDSILMRGAVRIGMKSAYEPSLVLHHHLSPHRFRFKYLMKLMHAYGGSHVVLETLLKGRQTLPDYYRTDGAFYKLLRWAFYGEKKKSLAFAVAQVAYHFGARAQHRKMK